MGPQPLQLVSYVAGSLLLRMAAASRQMSKCCDPPPKPALIGMPPKPPWIHINFECKGADIIAVEVHNQGGNHHGNTSTATAASVSTGSGVHISGGQIAAIVIVVILLLAILATLFVFLWYKKHYLKYQISPKRSSASSYQHKEHVTRPPRRGRGRSDRPLSQRSLVSTSSFTTSQASVSSGEPDHVLEATPGETTPLGATIPQEKIGLGETGEKVYVRETRRKKSTLGRSINRESRGSREPYEVSETQTGPDHGHPIYRGLAGPQPDIVESTLQQSSSGSHRSPLPVLRPIQSLSNPSYSHQHDPEAYPIPIMLSRSPRLPPISKTRKTHKSHK